jgi:hypothetical protein
MVVGVPEGDVELTCGGATMIGMDEQPPEGSAIDPAASEGTAVGKRYTNDAGDIEVLCTKAGEGSLGVGGEALVQKDAKALPSSD